jgi:hypothetical protein
MPLGLTFIGRKSFQVLIPDKFEIEERRKKIVY